MTKTKVSVVIVYYQDLKKFKNTLESVIKHKPSYVEIIIVDNSKKGIKANLNKYLSERFQHKINYIKSHSNLGYGAGNNLGIANANSNSKYIFILNPDTLIFKNTIQKLKTFLDKHSKTAIVAPNLIKPDGEVFPQMGSQVLTPIRGVFALGFINKLFPKNKISEKYWLNDLDSTKLRKVDVIPGSALMIRRKAFEEIGGYDEKMFLFFEESDIGLRLKNKGWGSYILPESQVLHYWKFGRKENASNKKHFEKSRFYYFRKHFGIINALVVESFAKLSKIFVLFFCFLILASFLRFYKIEENLVFHGELGHNYLAIKNAISSNQIPLLGPPTSHEWLDFGPLYYWIFAPILYLSKYSVYAGAYFFGFINILLIIINYFVIKKIFNRDIALISSILISFSPLFVGITRSARFFTLVTLIFYPFFYALLKRKYFWAAFWFGIMLNFHLTPLAFMPAILVYMFLQRDINFKNIKKSFMGILITQIPFLVSAPDQLAKILAWLPYRVVKNSTSLGLAESIGSLLNFLGQEISFEYAKLIGLLILFIIFYLGFKFKNKALSLLFLLFTAGLVSIFLHGSPPSHYFLPLYIIPIVFISYIFVNSSKFLKIILVTIYLIININNFKSFFNTKQTLLIPIKEQIDVVQLIINDAKGREFELHRVGYSDQFEGDYAQNYQYLLWLKGNEPAQSASISYTIYEDNYPNENIIYKTKRLVLTKDEN